MRAASEPRLGLKRHWRSANSDLCVCSVYVCVWRDVLLRGVEWVVVGKGVHMYDSWSAVVSVLVCA